MCESHGPKIQLEFCKSMGKVVNGNFPVSWCDPSFAVSEGPGRFWRGGFCIPQQLPSPEQAKTRIAELSLGQEHLAWGPEQVG